MIREIVKIDDDLCNGCGLCIPNCHEGALQVIDGKARLVSDLMCDGLGACLGHCPEGAITIEKREAVPYNETEVIKEMVKMGENTVVAHLQHLKEHNETEFLREGVAFLKQNQSSITFDVAEAIQKVHNTVDSSKETQAGDCETGGCPGSKTVTFGLPDSIKLPGTIQKQASHLRHWPVQLHLINPIAKHFQKSDLLIAADCTAFTLGGFHADWLQGKTLVIACPKLDQGHDSYINKIAMLIDEAKVNTITVMIMEVSCCGGLINMIREAKIMSSRNVPVKAVTVSIKGEILSENWL